jgi:hypothetical protein
LSPSDFVLLLEKDNRVGQDQLFKAILEALLRGFLERFFPDEAARLNFDTLRFLEKEVFANVQARCGRRTWWPDSTGDGHGAHSRARGGPGGAPE